MATQKDLRFIYQAKNNTTGLTNIKAQIYVNKVAKATGASAITSTANTNGSIIQEIDSANSPGAYEVLLKAADLTAWGVAQNAYSALEAYVNSTTLSAPAIFRQEEKVASEDDIDVKLGTPAGVSVSADIAAVKADTAAIKVDLESGPNSLATLNSGIQSIQNAVLQQGVGAVLPSMIIPSAGSNTYRIPITIQNDQGALVDPTASLVTVGILNQAGTDRGGNLSGSSGSPATVSATKDSTGQYHVIVTVQSTAVEEEWIFSFSYTIGSNAMVAYKVAQIAVDIAGVAQQTTLLDVQGDVDNIETMTTEIQGDTDTIITNLANLQTDVTNNVEGSGFNNATDSLHAISAYVLANLFQGGRAV